MERMSSYLNKHLDLLPLQLLKDSVELVLVFIFIGFILRKKTSFQNILVLQGAVAQSIPCVHSMNYDDNTLSTFLPVRIKCVLAGKHLPYDNNRKAVNGDDDNLEEVNGDKEPEKIEVIEKLGQRFRWK